MQILVATYDSSLLHRLSLVLEGVAIAQRCDPDAFSLRDAVLRAAPDLVILDMDAAVDGGDDLLAVTRALTDHDPDRHIIAIGDEGVPQAVLMGMRAGARDFLDRHIGDVELRARVSIYRDRARRRGDKPTGSLVLLATGMPHDGDGSLATNFAVLRARSGSDTLLVDMMQPASEAATILDVDVSYTVRNAIADLPRMDRTLLSSALARHDASGLHILPAAASDDGYGEASGDDLLALLSMLRGMFAEIVVNLGCVANVSLFRDLLRDANIVHLVALQKISSVKACRDLLSVADPSGQYRDHVHLVVDAYQDDIKLTETQIQQTLGLKHSARLPAARGMLANALNTGVPLVLQQPRTPYARALTQIACPAPKLVAGARKSKRLFGTLFREVSTNA